MSRARFSDFIMSFFGTASSPAFSVQGVPSQGIGGGVGGGMDDWSDGPDQARADEEARRARERQAFRRIQAPLLCRPAGLRLFTSHDNGVEADIVKVRIYSDERFELGDRLKLKIMLHGTSSEKFFAQVVWLEPLPETAHARYDVGLHVERIDEDTGALLRTVLRR